MLLVYQSIAVEKLKLELIRWVAELEDTEMLQALYDRMAELAYAKDSDTKVIGYYPGGGDVIKSRFVQGIVQAEMSITEGRYLTLSELERQSENW